MGYKTRDAMNGRARSATLMFYFLALIFMAISTFLSKNSKIKETPKSKQKRQKQTSSWDQIKTLLTCKQIEESHVHNPSKNLVVGYSKMGSSCSSICSFRDAVQHGNTRVIHRAESSPETRLSSRKVVAVSSMGTNGVNGSHSLSKGMQFRKLSGCYECHMIVDPSRCPASVRTTICACYECGEIFPKIESLELHRAVRHAVSELGQEDSGRNIVEMIFKSSWLNKDNPICNIQRILKVRNTQRTIQRFESYRDSIKARANTSTRKNHPRCAADGNELLRFHCTTLTCALGARGSSSLCSSSLPSCGVCAIIRHGFEGKAHDNKGVRTTASSVRAHNCFSSPLAEGRRAMLVCRVIAGRVKRIADDTPVEHENISAGTYDSIVGCAGSCTNLEELVVFNPRAILPCFVIIYETLD